MNHQPDDIRRYIRLTESSVVRLDEDSDLDAIEVADLDQLPEDFLENVNDLIFKFRSYSETDGSAEYAQGVEEGLALAANMLERLLERHSGHSSK